MGKYEGSPKGWEAGSIKYYKCSQQRGQWALAWGWGHGAVSEADAKLIFTWA